MSKVFLAEWRKLRGLSQERLAELAGLSGPYVSRLETKARMPPIPTLEKLARVLGVEVKDLFEAPAAEATEESNVIDLWRAIPPAQRQHAADVLKTFVRKDGSG